MPTSKHKLTAKADKITGGSGADVFVAPIVKGQATLTGVDRLDGGAGKDKITAALSSDLINPVMKNIETGIFTLGNVTNSTLDLSFAAQMTTLVFSDTAAHSGAAAVLIDGADHVSSISLDHSDQDFFELNPMTKVQKNSMHLSVDAVTGSTVKMFSVDGQAYSKFSISIDSQSSIEVGGNCVAARTLSIASNGAYAKNVLTFSPNATVNDTHHSVVQHLVVTGKSSEFTIARDGSLENLLSVDASALTGGFSAEFGGEKLTSYKGAAGGDDIAITTLGGSARKPAEIDLNSGNDHLLLEADFNAATQHFDGGKGNDSIELHGADTGIRNAVDAFENLIVDHAAGAYNVQGMGLKIFTAGSPDADVTIDHLAGNTTFAVSGTISSNVTVNLQDAASDGADHLTVLLQKEAQLGNPVALFNAPDVADLDIRSANGDHVMYLGSVSTSGDPTNLTISGSGHLKLFGADAAANYIASVTITDSAGADISSLAFVTQAFVQTGVTIAGGAGDDILVGGTGADKISTGGGDNTVNGSLGADVVTLLGNSGDDVLVFFNGAQSAYGSDHDTARNFGASDTIDISAIVTGATFAGNADDMTAGMALLSNAHASAFFDKADHTLYIDLNHDQQFTAGSDMQIQLDGVDSLQSANLIS